MKSPYQILGVSHDATEEEIKRAFRLIAKQTHPDLNGGDNSKVELFTEATEAYNFLMDNSKRAQYDYYNNTNPEYAEQAYEEYADSNDASATDFDALIREMVQDEKRLKAEARVSIFSGLIILVIGFAITFIGYLLTEAGGHYRIFTGAILLGGYGAIKGLAGYMSLLGNLGENEKRIWTEALGHEPTKDDSDFVLFQKIVHSPIEKLKTILTFVIVITCISGMCCLGYDMLTGEPIGFNSSTNSESQEISEQEKLYSELVEINSELDDMEEKIEKYESNLKKMEEEYNKAPSEELYTKYSDLYDEYYAYYSEYQEKLEEYQKKYDYFDKTYGFSN